MKLKFAALMSFALLFAGTVTTTGQFLPTDPDHPIKLGSEAPDFTVKDQDGKDVSLKGLRAEGKVALVFFRSADWCPFCQRQLIAINNELSSLKAAGIQVVGVSYDSVESLKRFASRKGIEFPLLSDPDSKVIDAYKTRNTDARGGRQSGIPFPATFIIGQDGKVIARTGHESYRDRDTATDIIKAAK